MHPTTLRLLAALLLAFLLPVAAMAAPASKAKAAQAAPFEVGIWLNHHLMAKGDAEIVKFLDEAERRGITAVYPNFWFHGYVIYPGSKLARQHPNFEGKDPLKLVVGEAQKRGMKVYPWCEYGFFSHYAKGDTSTDRGYILDANPQWAVRAKDGRSSQFNKGLNVSHFSMNPAHPEARRFLRGLFLEVADKYPAVDGVHVDRIRYQSPDFSYDELSSGAFEKKHGLDPARISPDDEEMMKKWTAWREAQTTQFMKELAKDFRKAHPRKEINGAVVPPYIQPEKFQRWDVWARKGYIDKVTPMIYGNINLSKKEIDETFAKLPKRAKVAVGLDVSMGPEPLTEAIDYARSKGAVGVVLWDDQGFLKSDMTFGKWSGRGETKGGTGSTPAPAPTPRKAEGRDLY